MKFDYQAFKYVCIIIGVIVLFLIIILIPACFNTQKPGELNATYSVISGCLLLATCVFLMDKYL